MGMRDIFGQPRAEQADPGERSPAPAVAPVSDSERLALLDAFEQSGLGWFWATDSENRLIYLSPSAQDVFLPCDALIGEPLCGLVEIVPDQGAGAGPRPLAFLLGSHSSFANRTVRLLRDGHATDAFWALSGEPHFDAAQQLIGFRGSARDVTREYRAWRESERLAQYDRLTGLANRQRMESRIDAMLEGVRRDGGSCALLRLDLDRFEKVKEALGQPAADELLLRVGQRLQQVITGPAEIGRLAEAEFQIALPDLDDRGRLGEMAERIIKMLSQPFALDEGRALIGASVGVAVAPFDGDERAALDKSAALALYAAKSGGCGEYRFFSEDLKNDAAERRELEAELRGAMGRGELEMHYQPIVDVRNNRVRGFEALMRWNHPARGLITPARFLPLAEQIGLLPQLGEWSLRQACADAAQWPRGIRVAVNIGSRQFSDEKLPDMVTQALEEAGLAPELLELEINEKVFMGDNLAVNAMVRRLQKLAVRLSLDDFGIGYSSLAFLRGAPFSCIKIDQSFVSGCTAPDHANAAIVTAFVGLARALGMQTIAEGVEVLDELNMVKALGADQVQGFVFSRAVPQAQLLEKLAGGNLRYEPAGPRRYRAERRATFRRIGVIHGNNRYEVVMRDLSRTGALIEGLIEVPVGTQMILDLGQGQLAVATVRRSQDASQGVEFETPLVNDGAGGLCTRHRVSPYVLAANGISGLGEIDAAPERRFMQVNVGAGSSRAA